MSKSCIVCGRDIHSKRVDAKFCSGRCRVSHHRSKALPTEMTAAPRWVVRDARKRPLVASSGRLASSTDPATWTTYAEAKKSPHGVGLGFVLGNGVGCVDLDYCFDGGAIEPWAADVIAGIPAPLFVERSQSGEGVHIFVLMDQGQGRVIRDGRNIEIYPPDSGRYIAVTGDRLKL